MIRITAKVVLKKKKLMRDNFSINLIFAAIHLELEHTHMHTFLWVR